MLKILLLLTLSLNAYSQQITGTISDQSSQQPIPYASIYYKNTDIGTYADATGKFKIPKLIDTLIISTLGYEKQIYPINHNTTTININLQPNIIHLNEISISANKKTHKTSGKKLRLGNLSSKKDIHVSGSKSHSIAYLVKNPGNLQAQIKAIHYNINSKFSQPNEALVRPQLYRIDPQTGKPGESILMNPNIIHVKKGNQPLVINLNHLGITLPPEGIYIGLEWLGTATWYTLSKANKPSTVYMKFMEKDWQIRPPKKQLNKTYFEEPNFSISVLAY
ncbi:MAG: carboxypeptidase-like regulatory domain-containing protein [Pedobacter sp.]|nr:MAG: carboxypeptidase-like regulatory domain-containing protein [Pedobacter sp.]